MIKMTFPKNSCYDRKAEVCSIVTPHPQGALFDADQFTVYGPAGAIPTQNKVTGKWADGSIKWLISWFEADLPANKKSTDYYLDQGAIPSHAAPAKAEVASDGSACIDTGAIKLALGAPGEVVFAGVSGAASFEKGEILGPKYKVNGEEYTAFVGKDGWKITQNGPILVRVETSGKHVGTAGEKLDFDLAIIAYAGKPYIEVEYRFIHKEEDAKLALTAMRVEVCPKTEGLQWQYATSNYATKVVSSTEEPIRHVIDSEYVKFLENEQIPEIHVGTYFCDWRDGNRGICTTFFQAYQNFPKGFDADKNGYTAWIIPESWGELDVFQGVARTTRFMLDFHNGQEDVQDLDIRSLYYQMPDKPVITSEAYEAADLYQNFMPKKKNINMELYIRRLGERTGHAYGMLCWGDYPDAGYTNQGRAHGDYVWTNNEYDYPHQAMIEYARTGERLFLDRMLRAADHWKDVDVCHYSPDPFLNGGQHMHSKDHVEKGCTPSHEWVEGLFDYYHVTGDEYAKETAFATAENVRYVLVNRIFTAGERYTAAREAGWALRTFCAMYHETYDKTWLEYGDQIVSYFDKWQKDYGAWLSPYTTTSMVRVPFMISVAVISLNMYYEICPSENLKNLIVNAVDDVIENCSTIPGGFGFYKELPSLAQTSASTLLMQAASVAYRLTGDRKYIDHYRDAFLEIIFNMSGNAGAGQNVKVPSHAVLTVSGASPKGFGQTYPALMSYYKCVMELGLLPEKYMTLAEME